MFEDLSGIYAIVILLLCAACSAKLMYKQGINESRRVNIKSLGFKLVKVIGDDQHVVKLFGTMNGQPAILTFKRNPLMANDIEMLLESSVLKVNSTNGKYAFYSGGSRSSGGSSSSSKGSESMQVNVICPASKWDVHKHTDVAYHFYRETSDLYKQVVGPHFRREREVKDRLTWIRDLLAGSKEKENLILDTPNFVMYTSPHWRGDSLDARDPNQLKALAICRADNILSVRDLRIEHVPLLKEMLNEGKAALEARFGIHRNEICAFVHYHPSFLWFHVHYARWNRRGSAETWRAHLLDDIIGDLCRDTNAYRDATITCLLPENSALFSSLEDVGAFR